MTKQQLITHLQSSGVLKTPLIIDAFQKIDRANFVPESLLDEAYVDHPLPIGHNQTISQPTTVVFMLELLQPKQGEKILDIGSGSGWTTALLAYIVGGLVPVPASPKLQRGEKAGKGTVFGTEIIPELAEFGSNNLQKYKIPWATIQLAKKQLGLPEQAPFDKILVSAAAENFPKELIKQLKVNGRLVMPIQSSVWQIDKISEEDIKKRKFYGFAFVPLK